MDETFFNGIRCFVRSSAKTVALVSLLIDKTVRSTVIKTVIKNYLDYKGRFTTWFRNFRYKTVNFRNFSKKIN